MWRENIIHDDIRSADPDAIRMVHHINNANAVLTAVCNKYNPSAIL